MSSSNKQCLTNFLFPLFSLFFPLFPFLIQSYLTQPDAGAVGVAVWVEAIARVLSTSSEQQQQQQQQQKPK